MALQITSLRKLYKPIEHGINTK